MKCPNCGTTEKALFKVCPNCKEIFATEDILAFHQLEYLVTETASWVEIDTLRNPYIERLEKLRARLRHGETFETKPTAEIAEPIELDESLTIPAEHVVPVAAPTPDFVEIPEGPIPTPEPAEKVPFDQWLLSERNIKIALYSGGTLLVLAGLIFVGVNWARIPGLAKFGITLFVTLMMFLSGFLLFRRSSLKLGGVALLAIGSGFVPLNFVVLQLYIFSAQGLSPNTMWLICSLFCVFLYFLIAHWTQADLFTYFSMAALVSTLTAILVLADEPRLVYPLVYALIAIVFLVGAKILQSSRISAYTFRPLLIVSQLTMPVIFIFSAANWIEYTGCTFCPNGNPWLAITTLFLGVIFYVITHLAFLDRYSAWAAAFGFAFTFGCTCIELKFSSTGVGVALMSLALVYLLAGTILERKNVLSSMSQPLSVAGYVVAGFVTFRAFLATLLEYFLQSGSTDYGALQSKDPLAKILVGDVLLLVLTAWIRRQYKFVYAAVWLFILPVYLFTSIATSNLAHQGWVLFALLSCYWGIGYFSGRRVLRFGGAFLTAAAGLSVIVPSLTWGDSRATSILLIIIAGLYIFCALWQRWTWLLYPALVGVHLSVLTVLLALQVPLSLRAEVLSLSYGSLGVLLLLGAIWLKQTGQKQWRWPLFFAAGLDVVGSYITALILGGWIAIGLSLVFAALMFALSWFERDSFEEKELPPFLSYLGAGFAFVGHVYILSLFRGWTEFWSPVTAGFCALFLVTAWLLRSEPLKSLYGTPLRWSGVFTMIVPLIGSLMLSNALLTAITFAMAAGAYLWLQWTSFSDWKSPPIFSYIGLILLFIGHFYLVALLDEAGAVWHAISAGFCTLYIGLAWFLKAAPANRLYGQPLRWSGSGLMFIPMGGAVVLPVLQAAPNLILSTVVFAIAGSAYAVDALIHRSFRFAYLGGAAYIAGLWTLLLHFHIEEIQAYALPLGLGLLVVGWVEHLKGSGSVYRWVSVLGLVILMGSAFYQSLEGIVYAVLLLVESLLALGWGIRIHSKSYVQLGVISLVVNAIAQLGPAFVEMDRWIQLGIIGTILLAAGLLALFRRDQLLATRRRLTEEWKQWEV